MSNGSRVDGVSLAGGTTISFGQRFQASEQFDQVFKEGMALVERTANYLDGAGRKEAKTLEPIVSMLYATESMRLTTRLLDLASWLLIRRALKEGEINEAEATRKRQRLKLDSLGRPEHTRGFSDLPSGIRGLIEESFALHDRIVRLDKALMGAPSDTAEAAATEPGAKATANNPVAKQFSLLERAFGKIG